MKIAIAGYGIEGKANFSYWNTTDNELTIVDEREVVDDLPENVQTILGAGAFSKLDGFDLVIRTASLNPKKIQTNGKIWSSTNEFFAKCPAPIIGVTGTKGKGTTSSLIASILRAAGKTVHLVGNIGLPGLSVLPEIQPEDVVVYELSSFQLWDAEKSPHVAVVLGIEADHLDVHANFDEYIEAKANIARFQTENDVIVYNSTNEWSTKIAETSAATQRYPYPYELGDLAGSLRIPGKHNEENASAAIAAVKEFVTDNESIKQGLSAFTGLPHRLKFVAEKNGVKYYDDSIATTPGSAIAAIRSFVEPKLLILGGRSKGGAIKEVIEEAKHSNTTILAIGEMKHEIAELCHSLDVVVAVEPGDMAQIVARSAALAQPGGVVILSPAASSFDMFKNYSVRGEQFTQAVEKLNS